MRRWRQSPDSRVVILGGGPVGVALAIELGQRGIVNAANSLGEGAGI